MDKVQLRVRLRRSLGLSKLPAPVVPVARRVGTIQRSGHRIEKLVLDSLPGMTVTAHAYVPTQHSAPFPAVLYAPGHWMENGKLEPDIQVCCANLAQRGCVVLVCDPIGQGERLGSWRDHGHLEPLLVGVSQAGLMVWESICAINYLQSRPDVDATRIGMTGASGGGLNTFYTTAIDSRITVSVPVCYVTSFYLAMTAERDRNWEDGVDLCNQVPEVMAYAEMSDILALVAPRPLCVVAGQRDWMFPIEGTREICRQTREVYRLHAVVERFHLIEVDAAHGYNREMREAAYGWLLHWLLGAGNGAPIAEQEVDLLPVPYPTELTYIAPPAREHLDVLRRRDAFPVATVGWCCPDGQAPPPGPEITRYVASLAAETVVDSPPPTDRPAWAARSAALRQAVRGVLGDSPIVAHPLRDRIHTQVLQRGLFAERVVFDSEPGIEIPALFVAPAEWTSPVPVVVYVDEWGKQAGLDDGVLDAVSNARLAVLAIDVRGVGETACSEFEAATNALMSDRPLFGQRVWDVVRAVDYLWHRIFISVQIDKGRIACLGRGVGGLLALYAAVLDERLAATVMWQAPVSYRRLIVEEPDWPSSVYLFDVLSYFDLPELMATIAPRPLMVAEPVDGEREPMSEADVVAALKWPAQAYRLMGAPDKWALQGATGTADAACEIAAWLALQLGLPSANRAPTDGGLSL
jgi:dienelactone hydrolase